MSDKKFVELVNMQEQGFVKTSKEARMAILTAKQQTPEPKRFMYRSYIRFVNDERFIPSEGYEWGWVLK